MEMSESTPRRSTGVVYAFRRVLSIPEMGVLVPLVALLWVFNSMDEAMLSHDNIVVMLRTMSYTGIIAVGQTLLMIAGELDLSVGMVAGLSGVVSSLLMAEHGWSGGPALLAGLLIGCIAGLINGLVTVKVGLPAFVTTLGMLFMARGISFALTNGYFVYGIADWVGEFGTATPLGLSWNFLIFVALVIIGDFILRQTIFGSMITATGGNKQAAQVAGINTDRVKIACFVLTGILASIAGLLVMANLKTGDPNVGTAWELRVIAICVIGGISLFGGVGTALGTSLGIMLMQVVRSGLVIVEVDINWQNVAVGIILAAAASVDMLRRRAKKY